MNARDVLADEISATAKGERAGEIEVDVVRARLIFDAINEMDNPTGGLQGLRDACEKTLKDAGLV